MAGALIPEGPLHPELALLALVGGIVAAVIARRDGRRWTLLVPTVGACVLVHHQGAALVDAYAERPDPTTALLATAMVAGAVAVLRPRVEVVAFAVLIAAVGVWAVVPDTEAPLVAIAVTVGALVVPPARGRSGAAALFAAMPVVAAVVGTAGRPARLDTALWVATIAGSLAAAGATIVVRRVAQRAGVPTTVTPAGTSSVTTAPAPTTAS